MLLSKISIFYLTSEDIPENLTVTDRILLIKQVIYFGLKLEFVGKITKFPGDHVVVFID